MVHLIRCRYLSKALLGRWLPLAANPFKDRRIPWDWGETSVARQGRVKERLG